MIFPFNLNVPFQPPVHQWTDTDTLVVMYAAAMIIKQQKIVLRAALRNNFAITPIHPS